MSLAKFLANPSDLPVSVANRIVAFLRLDRIFLIRKAAKRTALDREQNKTIRNQLMSSLSHQRQKELACTEL